MDKHCPLVLMILDGWGYREATPYNAIAKAHTPQWDNWWQTRPHMLLHASGTSVGLPNAQMGNSEVGHMHIGAGRIIPQDFTRINQAIADGSYAKNATFIHAIERIKQTKTALHILGLLSPGGVHSHEDHLFAFLELCAEQSLTQVHLHLFLDGRDTPPRSALHSIAKLQRCLKQHPIAKIATLTGRYYAMDRDKRWERIEPVYRLITEGQTNHRFPTAEEAIEAFYAQGIDDEFIPPTQIGPATIVEDNDTILCFNFRSDRVRQLTQAFLSETFTGFSRPKHPKLAEFISMTFYADHLPTHPAFPPISLKNTLGEVLAKHGLRQLRLAETEKYAHVTFFFNGGKEQTFEREKRVLVPSPKVNTYDLQPEMNAPKVTQTLIEAIESKQYDVIICNYANADMVGHTGNFSATVQAIEYLDQAMQAVWNALKVVGGQLLITADHGNAESMFDPAIQQPHTAHTNQPVPLLYIGQNWHFKASQGSLIDIAPTVLALLHIQPPQEMTGQILLVNDHETA